MLDNIMRACEASYLLDDGDIKKLGRYLSAYDVQGDLVEIASAPPYWVLEKGKYYVYSARHFAVERDDIIQVKNYLIETS